MDWTKGGADSPLAKVLIAVAALAITGTLIGTGVIKMGDEKQTDACGGCGQGRVCVREVDAERAQDGKLARMTSSEPVCRKRCDVLAPACGAGEVCLTVTGGGACFEQ